MATRAFSDLLPRVLPSVPGCPQPLAVQNIRDAAVRVCERTLAWRYVQPTFALQPGVHEYRYDRPEGAEVHALFEAIVNGTPLHRLTLEQALAQHPEWADLYSGEDPTTLWSLTPPSPTNTFEYNEEMLNGGSDFVLPAAAVAKAAQPRVVTQLTPDKYVVLPLPDAEQTYTMRMFYALRPSRSATGMDAVVFDELEEAITHSALQHLLVMPNVAWTDRELASYHAKQALFAATERRARANLGAYRGTLTANIPRFA